jgi:hypothetical protein
METAITFIALFATAFGIFYLHVSTRNKERLALIEKGADASLFNTGKEARKFNFTWSKFTLKTGMFFMGVALGIIVGAIIQSLQIIPDPAAYLSMIFFFGGLSLVLFYVFDRKNA